MRSDHNNIIQIKQTTILKKEVDKDNINSTTNRTKLRTISFTIQVNISRRNGVAIISLLKRRTKFKHVHIQYITHVTCNRCTFCACFSVTNIG